MMLHFKQPLISRHPLKVAIAVALTTVAAQQVAIADTPVLPMVQSTASPMGSTSGNSATAPYSSPLDSTQTEETITGQAISAMNPTGDFAQSLANLPNMNIVPTGNNGIDGSNIYMRGMDQSLINFTMDGIPINSPIGYGFYSNENLPPQYISAINVKPGPGSAATVGNANFAGTVAIHSVTPSSHFSATPFYGYGSFGTQSYGGVINSGEILGGIIPTKILLGATNTRSNGYFYNTQSHKYTFIFKSISQIGPGRLTLFFFQNNQTWNFYNGATKQETAEYGRRYSGNSADPGSPDYYGDNFKTFLNWQSYVKYAFHIGRLELSDQYYYFSGNGGGTFTQNNRAAPGGFYLATKLFPVHEFGNIFKARYPFSSGSLEAGVWADSDNETAFQYQSNLYNRFTGALVSAPVSQPVVTESVQPYVQGEWSPITTLRLTTGVKLLNLHRTWRDYVSKMERAANFNQWLPSFGVNYALQPNWHLYFNYTRSAEAPSSSQLTASYFNSGLQPEIANSYEAGTYWHQGAWGGRFTAFRTNFENYILSTPVVIGNQVFSTQSNAGAAIYQGLEFSNTYQITPWLSAFANFGMLDARMTSKNQPALQAPHHTEAVGLNVKTAHWQGMLAVQQIGSRYYATGATGNSKLDGYVAGSLSVAYDTGELSLWKGYTLPNLQISAHVNNLFNNDYALSASPSTSSAGAAYQLAQPINAFAEISTTF